MRALSALLLCAARSAADAGPCGPCSGPCAACKACANEARDAPCAGCTGGSCTWCWESHPELPNDGQPCLGSRREFCCRCWSLTSPGSCKAAVPPPLPPGPAPPAPAPSPPAPAPSPPAPAPGPPRPPPPVGPGATCKGRKFAYYNAAGPHSVKSSSMGTKQSGCFTAWYPTSTPPAGGWPVYHFICGTTSPPSDYAATLKHVASHGIFAVANYMDLDLTPGLPKGTYPISTKCAKSLTTGATPVKVDARNIVSGGHSGGGPLAVRINDDFQGNYVGYVGQHAAAIVGSNKPTKAQLAKVRGKVLQMCGTKDTMPTCGCSDAKNSYYDRYPAATPRALLKSPGTHITGVCKDSGDRNEGGSVVAFLSYVLNGDACGREALHEKRSGYSFQDDLGSSPAPPPSPPPPTPPAPPPVPPPTPSTYACIAQQCVAADSGVDLPICQAAC